MVGVNMRTAAIALVSVVLIGAGAALILTGGLDRGVPENPTVAIENTGPVLTAFMNAGFGSQAAVVPENVSFEPRPEDQVAEALSNKEVTAGLISLVRIKEIRKKNPDMRVIPAYFAVPPNLTGIYASTDSNIFDIGDLEGRLVGYPADQPQARTATIMGLQEQTPSGFGRASIDTYPVVEFYNFTMPRGNESARYLFGYPDSADFRSITFPFEHVEERFGVTPPLYVLVVSDPAYTDFGFRLAESYRNPPTQRILRVAGDDGPTRRAVNALQNLKGRSNMVPFTPAAQEAANYIINYESTGILPGANISRYIAEP